MAEFSYLAAWITWLAQRREGGMSVRQSGGKNTAEVSIITGTSRDTARL